jgi:hypothetical protein
MAARSFPVTVVVAVLVLGVGIGLGGGWALWGRRDGELSAAEAEKMLVPYVTSASATCVWEQPRKRTDTTWQFYVDDANAGCAKALLLAGVAKPGACLEPGCPAGCCQLEIKPTADHGSKWGATGLEFSCGTLAFGKILSISTKDKAATVKYTRTATLDAAMMKTLEPCVLAKTEGGEKERERNFRRNDDGSWTMIEK